MRGTTRVEDEAYCLFGLFDVNLPTLYGEGRNAFYRLQEEIIRNSIDLTLCCYGTRLPLSVLDEMQDMWDDDGQLDRGLLATSPSSFYGMKSAKYDSSIGHTKVAQCEVSSHGCLSFRTPLM